MNALLVDAGPLIAILHRDDQHHLLCVDALSRLTDPLVSAWPVLIEAMCLLNFSSNAQDAFWELLEDGTLKLLPLEASDYPRMRELMRKYRSLAMDLADAALVRLAEREQLRRIFTLDRRDFTVYRPARIGRFSIIP